MSTFSFVINLLLALMIVAGLVLLIIFIRNSEFPDPISEYEMDAEPYIEELTDIKPDLEYGQ